MSSRLNETYKQILSGTRPRNQSVQLRMLWDVRDFYKGA